MRSMIRQFYWTALLVLFLSGCNLKQAAHEATAVPRSGNDVRMIATANPAPPTAVLDDTQDADPAGKNSETDSFPYRCEDDDAERSARRISAVVDVDYAGKTAAIDEKLSFLNREDTDLNSIVIDVQANQWDGSFILGELTIGDLPAYHEISSNRLEIPLALPLPQGCEVEITMRFSLQPGAIRDGLRSYRGFFGYSPRQLNLAHFLPTVAARVDGEWRIHEPIGIGEQIVYDIADWLVDVTVGDAAESLQLAAPGSVTDIGVGRWQIELLRSRDLAISLSEEFQIVEGISADGVTVRVFGFADARASVNSPGIDSLSHTLRLSVSALELFTRLFGRYPYDQFVVVQGDFPDGMEFTGLVFVGSAWFTHFDGTPYNYLTLISAHEIAHQWWYARVGSDSALNPWLDEALATYSEYLFIESQYPADKNWWWTFRVAGFFPQGQVDSTVYDFTTAREYINAIYLRGAQMLHNLREDIGNEQFFTMLKTYAQTGAGRIVNPGLFWDLLPSEQMDLTLQTRGEFLRDPTVQQRFVEVASDAG